MIRRRNERAIDIASLVNVRALLIALFTIAPAAAFPSAGQWSQDDFHVQRWGVAEGLPGNHVEALAQDSDGFLWLATMAGLVRFDGIDFHVFNENVAGVPSGRFTSLDAGPSNRLWIGTEFGHVVVRDRDGFHTVVEPTYPNQPVEYITEAGDGSVWFIHASSWAGMTNQWLWQLENAQLRPREDLEKQLPPGLESLRVSPPESPGGDATQYPVLGRDEDGQVWARPRGGAPLRLESPSGLSPEAVDPTLHMMGSTRLAVRLSENSSDLIRPDGQLAARLQRTASRLRAVWLEDRRGLVWVSTIDGVEVHDAARPDPLAAWDPGSRVLDVIEDFEGNIWIATRRHGIMRIRPAAVGQLGPGQGVPLPASLRAGADGSAVMSIQAMQPVADSSDPGQVLRLQPDGSVPVDGGSRWELIDSRGRYWKYGNDDLQGTRADGTRQRLALRASMLHEDPSLPDILWASNSTSLVRIRVFEDRDPEIDGKWPILARSNPWFDPDGGLWIGGAEGLHLVRDSRHQVFGRDDGLPVNEIRTLFPAEPGGLWIGTYGGGLVHLKDSTFTTIDHRHGLVDDTVSSIVADDFGAFWMSGNRGIQRVLRDDLHAFIDGRAASVPSMLFGEAQGLSNAESIGAHSGVRVGQRLYFSTFGGLVVIDPAVVAAREEFEPRLHLLTDTGARRLGAESMVEVSPGRDGFELQASAIHLSAPETLRYRYRLLGHDDDWIDNGSARGVSFSGLSPGRFRLEVQARHSGGPWVEASASPAIAVLPFWWETPAARLAGLIIIAMLFGAGWMAANRGLRSRARALESVVKARTRDLQHERDTVAEQAGRLRELADGRARFIAGISHELRTPLTLIRGPLDALAEGREKNDNGRSGGMIEQARDNVDRLQALIDRLLESARLEGGAVALSVREVNLPEWLTDLARRLRPLFDDRGSRLVAEIPEQRMPAWIDPVLMDSAITNLLVNALRHGPAGGTATLSVRRDADGRIAIDVVDDGPGIVPEHREHVFERFYRARGEQSRGSYGLGLWLVRQIVERHHGTVDLLDNDGGAHFRVRIAPGPDHFQDAEIGETPDESPNPADTFRYGDRPEKAEPCAAVKDVPTVLVVDDHAGIRALVRDALGQSWQVTEAADGQAALDAVRMRLPDVIVSDVMMPRIDGIELLRTLRGDSETDFLPIVLLTAKSETDDRIAGLEHGADAYLAKPFDRRELHAVVDGLLTQRKRLRAHLVTPTGTVADEADPDRPAWAPEDLTEQQRVFLNRFQAAVEARIADENLTMDDLAETLGQSRATLYRKLKQATARSPSELIREIRLARAYSLLEQGAGSVSEVGYAVGFKSVAHFSNTFRSRFGVRPSALGP